MRKLIKISLVAASLLSLSALITSCNTDKTNVQSPPKMVGTNSGTYTPKYLSVPEYKQCLETHDFGTWKGYCLPSKIKNGCPTSSFKELGKLNLIACQYDDRTIKKLPLEPGPVIAINGKPIDTSKLNN
ncbi:hypothetical protein [Francisella sp. LA112445]|jgi:hypothetical protein|uniref:hypothetical protein n=1 Tax=Francisella sp. LA112445 TaxID=1395624 RepID=UPI001788A695|nr:hypothetical protein [Francisella sp. LA112445]QIW10132.1 hypothetical protein FIP56_05295 [Francisella sp. LA112445]